MGGRSNVRIIEIQVTDGDGNDGTILAEVAMDSGPADVSVRRFLRLDDARATITETARWVIGAVRSGLPEKPDKIGVDFGVKLAVKSGKLTSVLAEANGEAAITVRLEWTPDKSAPEEPAPEELAPEEPVPGRADR
ncbi:CU044_2847 family protein [Actinosynnema sp. NPDC050801]|uniref:CU044_2847 family protein n=1 Tax=unclassified Actinosynnema TaxID=2637065 RepID=UPI0033FD0814